MESTKATAKGTRGYIWYVGFRKSNGVIPLPWRWLCKENYEHVFAMRYDAKVDCWVLCEWLGRNLHIELLTGEKVEWMFHQASVQGNMIAYEGRYPERLVLNFRMPIYCVTWVKHLLGLKGCFAVTPYQLFCALRKRGGSVMFSEEKSDGTI